MKPEKRIDLTEQKGKAKLPSTVKKDVGNRFADDLEKKKSYLKNGKTVLK